MAGVALLGLLALCSPGQAFSVGLGSPEVGAAFCCPEGEVLVATGGPGGGVECRVGEARRSLEGKEVWTGGEDGEKRALKKLDVKTPTCRRGLRWTTVRINSTENQDNIARNLPLFNDIDSMIELRGSNSAAQGNVYVTINGVKKPVCDDEWGDVDARVACRMLGYAAGGRATRESRFGAAPGGNFGMDDVQCQGNEKSLLDCRFASHDDCVASEAAGVICAGSLVDNDAVLTAEGGLTFPQTEDRYGDGLDSDGLDSDGLDRYGDGLDSDGLDRYGNGPEELEEAKVLEPGTFCLVEGFTIDGSRRTAELTAVYCDSCLSQLTCAYAKMLYQIPDTTRERERGDQIFFVADTDGNGRVDFEEFHAKLKEYLNVVFNALDINKDGSIYDEAMGGNAFQRFSLTTFESVVGEVMDFFDSNQDDAFSIEDSFIQQDPLYQYLRRKGQDVTLTDMLNIPSLISLPAPLYNLYSHLDRNTDEALTRDEALDFITRMFTIIDTNSDCHIDSDEVVALLTRLELPWDVQLSVKVLLEQTLSVASYMLKTFVEQADMNSVNRFNNFEFMEKVLESGPIWIPERAFFNLFVGVFQPCSPEEYEARVVMWLTALQGLMEEPALSGAPPAPTCSGF